MGWLEQARRRVARTAVLWQLRLALAVGLVATNLVGAVMVYCLAALVVPLPDVGNDNALRVDNLVLVSVLVPVAVLIGSVIGNSLVRKVAPWIAQDRDPTAAERIAVLRLPRRLFIMQAALWTLSAFAFAVFNASASVELGVLVGLIVALSGLSNSSFAYLVAERVTRPLARRALSSGVPDRTLVRTVAMRSMNAWLLGTGVAVVGIVLVGISVIGDPGDATADELALTMIVLGGIAFVFGGLSSYVAARASSDPVRALRRAVAQVREGNLEAEVPIYDGTEVGILQAGFNDMLHGLREREKIRDLFGRHVGDDVARTALEHGVELGGEVREIAVLFVDIVGSTAMATNRPPEEVVAVLNRFFDIVIDVVHQHGGWINKFEGDAALAIWGAPEAVPRMEAAVLTAARVLGERLRAQLPGVEAAVGVSAGPAVAGNVGAAQRSEYTVIGDPVNEAARLTELAKEVPGMVVANAALLGAAGEEGDRWRELAPVVVRGRSSATRIAAPALDEA